MNTTGINIGGHIIAKDSKPFIIVEAGINHNGQIEMAFEMIKVARKEGADCKEVTESMLEMFKRYEFSREEWFSIKKKCDEEGIIFLSTPQNVSGLNLLLEIGVEAIKVGSDDFTNIPLLKNYAQTGLPLMVSCGMSDLAEVYQALEAIGSLDGYPTVLMLCTSQYPTPPENVNLYKLKTLGSAFPMVILGFSDHTQGPLASSLAVAMG